MSILLKSIPLFLSLVLLTNCISDFEVRQCIKNLSDGADMYKICKKDDNRSCFNSYYSMNLCLINNKCYDAKSSQQMPYNCWHCWAQLQVDNDQMKQFQKKIGGCAWAGKIQSLIMFTIALVILII